MVHSGYEASAVDAIYSSLGGFLATVKATLFTRYRDKEALRLLDEPQAPVHPLVQIAPPTEPLHETRA
jgi:hypothetical protein